MDEKMEAVDVNGRKYRLREITPGAFMDLLEAAGKSSQNAGYVRYAMQVCSVSHIDDVPKLMPADQLQLRARADEIGNAGMVAIFATLFPEDKPGETKIEDKAEPTDATLAAAGN